MWKLLMGVVIGAVAVVTLATAIMWLAPVLATGIVLLIVFKLVVGAREKPIDVIPTTVEIVPTQVSPEARAFDARDPSTW